MSSRLRESGRKPEKFETGCEAVSGIWGIKVVEV